MARVIPIPKKGNSMELSNLRPISILPALSKVCERLIKDQLVCYLDDKSLINPFQSGFRKSHSTTSTVIDITEQARSNLDKSKVTVLILLDFSKAFDSIDHNILLSKLSANFSLSGSAIKLIYSYLFGRSQCVSLAGKSSSFQQLHKGVPQGTILGPLLFSLFINDLPRVPRYSLVHLFADDVQLLHSALLADMSLCISQLNLDLAAVSSWAIANGLMINPSKSQAIAFFRYPVSHLLDPIILNGTLVPFSSHLTSLGFVLDETLSWDNHINLIISRVWSVLRKLYLVRDMLPFYLRKMLVSSLIMPFFVYGAELFSGTSMGNISRLNVCFNACIRFICSLRLSDHISGPALEFLGIPFPNFLKLRTVTFLFKVLLKRLPSYLLVYFSYARSLRTGHLIIPSHSSSIMDKSFTVRAVRLWNSLPWDVRGSNSVHSFVKQCRDFMNLNLV